MNAHTERSNPYTVTLGWLGSLSLVVAVVLGLAASYQATSYLGDAQAAVALGAWSDFLLLIGGVAIVSAIALGGVRWLLATAKPEVHED